MIDLDDLVLVIIDVQDRILKIIPNREQLVNNITILAKHFKELKRPSS